MTVAHLSDLHLRTGDDVAAFGRQLDHIVRRSPTHTVITGDLLDRWQPELLERALDALQARDLLDARKLTILHGNHDLASSGGHPRARRDLWRLAVRFWDPPPVLVHRRRAFYRMLAERARGIAAPAPYTKEIPGGIRLAVLDSVPLPWMPAAIRPGRVTLKHGEAALALRDLSWLAAVPREMPLLLLMHHYPLPVPPFEWNVGSAAPAWLKRVAGRWTIAVPMELPPATRERLRQAAGNATAILCGHVHRARVDEQGGLTVCLNGQSGADWAGRTIAYYTIEGRSIAAATYQEGTA